jgi:hemolysin activation/secretion protein
LFDRKLLLSADLWAVNRPKGIYSQAGDSLADYLLNRQRLNVLLNYELQPQLAFGAGVTLDRDQLESMEISPELSPSLAGQLDQAQAQHNLARAVIRAGKLNYDNLYVRGRISTSSIYFTLPIINSDSRFYKIETVNQLFYYLPLRANLGLQFRAGATNSDKLQYLFYLGGFDNIRGYFDGQLRGQQFWQLNTEYRIPVVRTYWFTIQANSFVDVAQTENTDGLYYSAGLGLRFGSRHIYRFVGRLDIALATSHAATSRISFGAQQFF